MKIDVSSLWVLLQSFERRPPKKMAAKLSLTTPVTASQCRPDFGLGIRWAAASLQQSHQRRAGGPGRDGHA